MHIFFKIVFYVALTFFLICLFLYFKQEKLIFFPEKLPRDFKFTFPVPFEELMFDVDDVKINALHFKAEYSKGVVLYFHGNAENLRDWGMISTDFTKRGYDVLIPDYRGYGKSTGNLKNEDMLFRDAAFIYEHLKKSYDENDISIYGRSLGTGIAVHLTMSSKPRMIILESPFCSIKDVAKYHYPFIPQQIIDIILRYPMMSDLKISQVASPFYFIHGTEDEIIPYESSLRLIKLVKTKASLITIEGKSHNDLSESRVYHEALDRILQ